ncbi:hypothetical protein [Acanthopleuribacter pedis]|uniref:Uncharacterized protein n=1 Tax=Acanthopleuribacter pedis TaxID=442870 RepID=A0A8J7Q5B1_9BACT|nr:hypothetical protein [Acanthopleuribacter pedis]MBO1319350.1 hypothetical protein [Acanthopleuribacter pedis]
MMWYGNKNTPKQGSINLPFSSWKWNFQNNSAKVTYGFMNMEWSWGYNQNRGPGTLRGELQLLGGNADALLSWDIDPTKKTATITLTLGKNLSVTTEHLSQRQTLATFKFTAPQQPSPPVQYAPDLTVTIDWNSRQLVLDGRISDTSGETHGENAWQKKVVQAWCAPS